MIRTFDPFSILQVAVDADEKAIKKSYRKLSLQYHPDRNMNDPMASANFIQISKAYKTLTDEVAKSNYAKYGNPDGPSTMKVSIGLPRVLVEEKNQILILTIFSIVLLFAVPMAFIAAHMRQKKYSASGVIVDTLNFLGYVIQSHTRADSCPEFLAASSESRMMALKPGYKDEDLSDLKAHVVEPTTCVFKKPAILCRNRVLIHAHLQRKLDLLSDVQKADIKTLLEAAPRITQSMVEIAIVRDMPNTAMAFVYFRRSLFQAIDCSCDGPEPFKEDEKSLLQVPHLTASAVKGLVAQKCGSLKALVDMPSVDREKVLGDLDEQQRADVETFVTHLPRPAVSADVCVEGENEVEAGDIATITVRLDRQQLKKGEAIGPAHAPYFPVDVPEVWWFFVINSHNGRMLACERSKSAEKEVKASIMFRVVTAGKYKFTVKALCDSYLGFDQTYDLEFTANEPKQRDYKVHPEDVKLDQVPTLFQQMMGVGPDEDEDSDDDKAAPPKKTAPPTTKKKEEEDDSDSSTESD
jgi:translocation protein SEC63